ncbi:RNA polymerase sigma-70 factor (sigma-E family) [Streptomyces sp. Ag109_O5-1]|uniref:SigE family RNA polymerase sigma factor n=1 Tax=Streptomyces sp. Ag109_O5-1 TaxID=1938851 RepID=UPI000F507ED1|nr:SigE family RNA polymerase sigma factor [Streptomyces sp. Ag109_O5-1]RPE39123.1 RNA polymerase sigma-70 factor (sigma-E family) [Streptomyces sp. Ag109_O5-1]
MTQRKNSTVSAPSTDFAAYSAAAWPGLVRTAHLLTGDFHEAEDLVRTTLAKVYARWWRIPRNDAGFFVRRSLVENSLSRVRKKRVARLLMPFAPKRVHQPKAGSAERRATVDEALAGLSARQRTVLVLRYWENFTEAEVAQLLGCSLRKVRARVRGGLAALRAHPALDVHDRALPTPGIHELPRSTPEIHEHPLPTPGARR